MKLFINKRGEGKPLIILHGLFGSSDNWQSLAKLWSGKFEVFTVDLRNHGRSPHSEEMNYDLMVEDLLDLFADQGLRDVLLLGHSMGGKVALRFAQEYPGLVARLVVVDMGVKEYKPHHGRIFEGLFHADAEHASSRNEVSDRLAPFVDDPATLQFLLKNLYWKEPGQLAWRFNLPSLFRAQAEVLKEIPENPRVEPPTLFIRGERSGYIVDTDLPNILNRVPNAIFRTIRAAGHWPHAEAPDEFYAVVTEFLDED
jgi:pimeloyl-ACP methyl ester carboxylesterase